MPFVVRLKLTGLTPNATYRYFTGMSSFSNLTAPPATPPAPLTGHQSPGAMYRINNGQNATYGHITGYGANKAIAGAELQNDEMITTFNSQDGRHCRFTTDGSGSYTGWFTCVTVGNATQQAMGSDVYFYVQLNNGGTGTTLVQSYRTTSTIKLLDYSTVAGDANGCTALLGTSDVGDEKMVAIYDNTAATGRPLYCTFTENNNNGGALNEGTIWNNPLLYPTVDGKSGSWAAILPNNLSGGVKAINFLNINDASAITLSNAPLANTSADGSWNGVSTASPAGGATAPITINSIAGTLLPVKMLSFSGIGAKDGVRLFWTTAEEINNKHFEITRAGSDGQFKPIGRVNAAAIPDVTNEYSFVDRQPLAGKNYYQLKQVDKDGSVHLSKTVYVNAGQQRQAIRLVASGTTEIAVAITAGESSQGDIMYTDMQGRVLYKQSANLKPGENIIRIQLAGLSMQMGVISFTDTQGERVSLKVIM